MKKIARRIITILLALVAAALCLTGCDDPEPIPSVAISLVLGNHANSYVLNLSNPDIVSAIALAAADGYISVIRCDGKPETVSADFYAIPAQYRNADPAKLEADAKKRAANILASLTDVKAEAPELDTLEALWKAAGSLELAPADAPRQIMVIDTGLSTCGKMDFRNNLLEADPEFIAEFLDEQGALPDLTGFTVKWFQLGVCAPPQAPLSHGQISKLKRIWTAIIEKKGGTVVFSGMVSLPQVNDPAEYPEISVVKLPPETTLSFDPTMVTVFDEQQVQFVADTAIYADPEAAAAALRPAAEYIMAHPEFTALLIGTTASGDEAFCLQLSRDRVGAVRGTLVSMGVPESQLLTRGLGYDDPWHIPDRDSGGRMVEKLASQNRKVVLMDADNPAARDIINST